MTDEEKLLEKRLSELYSRSQSGCCYTSSEFLSIAGQDVFMRLFKGERADARLLGGFDACERKLAFFGSEELCGYEQLPPIACVRITPKNAKFSGGLTHRDFLGAIMGLGIKRETVGDIFISDGGACVFCLEHIAPYIAENLLSVGRTYVNCSVTDGIPEQFEIKTEQAIVNVASERLDAVIAGVYNLSRSAAGELIDSKRVFLNSRLQEGGAAEPKAGDIVSVRGLGRFRYIGVEKETKKGRLFVLTEKYI